MVIHALVHHGRYSNELFTSTKLENEAAFGQMVAALQAKGFKVEVARFELTDTVCLTVTGLRSDRAVAYAEDILRRAGRTAGFSFLSTEHK